MLPLSTDFAARRARSYWNIDGLPEIFSSLLILLTGAYCTVGALKPLWLSIPVWALFVAAVLASRWYWDILEWLKARWTYPRTGYAPGPLRPEELQEMRREELSLDPAAEEGLKARFRLWAPQYRTGSRAWFLAGFVPLLAMNFWAFRWAPFPLATAAALAFWRARAHPELFSFRPLVFASLPVAGLLVSLAETPLPTRLGWVLLSFGAAGLLSGLTTVWQYRKTR